MYLGTRKTIFCMTSFISCSRQNCKWCYIHIVANNLFNVVTHSSKIYLDTKFKVSVLTGASVAPYSEIRKVAILGYYEVRTWNAPTPRVRTKFHENTCTCSKVEKEPTCARSPSLSLAHLGWYGKPSISSTAYVTIVGILARALGLQLGECRAAQSFLSATCSTLFNNAVFQMNQWRNGPSSIRGLLDALANGHTMLKIPVLVKSPKPSHKPRLALGWVTV
jgi:hypothetical protein